MEHKTAKVELSESNARYTLVALRELNEKLNNLSHDENIDEDERFFHANDLMEASRALEKIEAVCVSMFGEQILVNDHEVL
jgi:hypothetical protein